MPTIVDFTKSEPAEPAEPTATTATTETAKATEAPGFLADATRVLRDLQRSGLALEDLGPGARIAQVPELTLCKLAPNTLAYVIPYYNIIGQQLPYFRLRVFDRKYKYAQEPGAPNFVYFPQQLQQVLRNPSPVFTDLQPFILITEGEKKAAAATKAGIPCVALGGVDSWRTRLLLLPNETKLQRHAATGDIIARLPRRADVATSAGLRSFEPTTITIATGLQDLIDLVTAEGIHVVIAFDTELNSNVQRAAHSLACELMFRGVPMSHIHQLLLVPPPNGLHIEHYQPLQIIRELERAGFQLPAQLDNQSKKEVKIALDDFLYPETEHSNLVGKFAHDTVQLGVEGLHQLLKPLIRKIDTAKNLRPRLGTFPKHPNAHQYIQAKLQAPKLSRKQVKEMSQVLVAELDIRGIRMRERSTGLLYYFSKEHKTLSKIELGHTGVQPFHESAFGRLLFSWFGISTPDLRLLQWLAAEYATDEGLMDVDPQHTMCVVSQELLEKYKHTTKSSIVRDAVNGGVAIQLDDAHFALVTCAGAEVFSNGTFGILFEQDAVEPLDIEYLAHKFEHLSSISSDHLDKFIAIRNKATLVPKDGTMIEMLNTVQQKQLSKELLAAQERLRSEIPTHVLEFLEKYLVPWWLDVMRKTSMLQEQHRIAAVVCYLSPWLRLWQGLQLPIEIAVGEAGSGKTSVYSLRQIITTGRPELKPVPNDIRDWYASITSSGGLHVTDNVNFTKRDMKQRISDEMCRLVTDPDPHVELRRLYTTSTNERIPVRAVFAMTAIQEPFHQNDLLQRSLHFRFEALEKEHLGNWAYDQLECYGGREEWLIHHIAAIRAFLSVAVQDWDTQAPASHRLAHLEQAIKIMSKAIGIPFADRAPLLKAVPNPVDIDWVLEGIYNFTQERLGQECTVSQISSWALQRDEYRDNEILTNTRKLGRYIAQHKAIVKRNAGLETLGKKCNRMFFRCIPVKGS